MTNKRKYDSISESVTADLKWLYCERLYKYEILKVAYLVANEISPNYFRNYAELSPVQTICTRSRQYSVPQNRAATLPGSNSFRFAGPSEITLLPNSISFQSNFPTFKNLCLEFLLNSQYTEYCLHSFDDIFCDLSCIDDVISSLLA